MDFFDKLKQFKVTTLFIIISIILIVLSFVNEKDAYGYGLIIFNAICVPFIYYTEKDF